MTIRNSLEAYLAIHEKLAAEISDELAKEDWEPEGAEALADQMLEIERKLPPELREKMR